MVEIRNYSFPNQETGCALLVCQEFASVFVECADTNLLQHPPSLIADESNYEQSGPAREIICIFDF